ncbi:MAG: DctP family TRAP transporter solute-binding subunit [Actinobacteria bacterium]|nr:DctP family TRAP transporter solute-binding subunit [Actinomycetota bacterium]
MATRFAKWQVVAAFTLILALVLLAGCGGKAPEGDKKAAAPEAQKKDDVLTIKFAHAASKEHPYHVGALKFAELVSQKSNGKMKVEIFSDAQLGSEREEAEGVRMGTINMATVAAEGAIPNWVPEMQVFGLPFLFRDRSHAYSVLDGPIGAELSKKLEAQGFKNLGYWEIGIRHLTNKVRPVNKPADVKGLKIRVQESKVWIAHMKALGALPTPIPFGELYSALQQGVVDGQENPITTIQSMRFYEVQKYVALTAHTYSPAVVIVNPQFYAKLTPDQQKIIQDAVKETASYQRQYVQTKEKEGIDFLKGKGIVITEPDRAAFAEATKNVVNEIKDQVPPELVDRIRNTK